MWDIESDALFEGISSNYQVPLQFISIQIYVDLVRNVIIDLDFRPEFLYSREITIQKHDWKIITKIIYIRASRKEILDPTTYIFPSE